MAVCRREKSCPQEHTEVLSTMETAPLPWHDDFISNMAKRCGFQESPPGKKKVDEDEGRFGWGG